MKSSALFKVYMSRLIPIALIIIVALFLIMCDEIVFIRNSESIFIILIIAATGGVLQFLIRAPKEHTFVNSLPVTKKYQWKCMYLSLLIMTAMIYIAYIAIVYIRCHNEFITFSEIALSGFVKGTTAVFAVTLVLWILSHTDFYFSGGLFPGIVILICSANMMGELIQKAFNTGTNNFVYALLTYWKLMTVPLKLMNDATTDFGKINFAPFSEGEKLSVTLFYLMVILMITAILAVFACKNYSEIKLEKNMNKGHAKKFSKVLTGIFATIVIFGIISAGIGTAEKITLKYNTNTFSFEDDVPEKVYEYNDATSIKAYKDGQIYYEGIMYKNDSENYLLTYKIYEVEFPRIYLYAFWINVCASIIGGILAVVIHDRIIMRNMQKGEAADESVIKA